MAIRVSNNLKRPPIPVVPARTQIVNGDGTVTRTGQLLLEQLQAATAIEGTHANRPDPNQTPDGALYVESDRGVVYYNQGGAWHYLAGTMWGLLNPDERPTDLGVNDAGFEYRTIDTNAAYAPREFIWSQSEWIETTLVLYGTHAGRPAADEKTPPRTLYIETDRGNVIYQQQADAWVYVAGVMLGTISPDQRPADLGANDTGFRFQATDTMQTFVWNGAAWNDLSLYGSYQQTFGTGSMSLTTTATPIPGLTLTLAKPGLYALRTSVDMAILSGTGITLICEIAAGGTGLAGAFATLGGAAGTRGSSSAETSFTATAGAVITVLAYMSGGTTGASVYPTNCSLSATWIHP